MAVTLSVGRFTDLDVLFAVFYYFLLYSFARMRQSGQLRTTTLTLVTGPQQSKHSTPDSKCVCAKQTLMQTLGQSTLLLTVNSLCVCVRHWCSRRVWEGACYSDLLEDPPPTPFLPPLYTHALNTPLRACVSLLGAVPDTDSNRPL